MTCKKFFFIFGIICSIFLNENILTQQIKEIKEQNTIQNYTYIEVDPDDIKRYIRSDSGSDQQLEDIEPKRKNEIQNILDLLQKGEENIKYSTIPDVILLLGITGSGKSTFAQYISGNDHNLISKETEQDANEFLIIDIDNSNKISSDSTITSHTIFPEVILDSETNTAFYDCPGFSDTRSAAHDIASTYFIKKIIDSANAIKLVFTVSYPSVRQGVNRLDFMLLIKHAVTMIKNIDRFKDSIALIVTKVDNLSVKNKDKSSSLMPDENIIRNIATFMKKVRDELETNIDQFNENAVKFIDILLEKDGNNYKKIGVFKRPDEPGILSSKSLLKDGKKSLRKILYENLQFTIHDKSDFGYTISADSQNYVYTLVEKINENLARDKENLVQEIRKYYYTQEEELYDIQKLYKKLKLGYDSLSATKIKIRRFVENHDVELQDFIKHITKNINDLNISISSKNLLNIANYAQYLKFIKSISNQSTIKPLEWAQELTNIIEFLNNSQKWYDFLIRLHTILSKYDIQKDINQYANLTNNLKYQIASNGPITAILKKFLDQVMGPDSEREFYNIKDIKLDNLKLNFLNTILDLTLKDSISISCENQKLLIKGHNIKLSDILKVACNQPKFIEIFALNKVFIDTDLNKSGDKVSLSIIAPTWDFIDSYQIILDGKPGIPHDSAKARNGIGSGGDGEVGKPGLSGNTAGNFLGIWITLINYQHLDIFANGGKGGPGQHGGDGVDGKNGKNPELPKSKKEFSLFQKKFIFVEKKKKREVIYNRTEYDAYGTDGDKGGNGGDGGLGGKGGNPGYINIIGLYSNPEISAHNGRKFIYVYNDKGLDGINGIGGKGGVGGQNGDFVSFAHTVSTSFVVLGMYTHSSNIKNYYEEISRKVRSAALSGNLGKNGHNDKEIQQPEEPLPNTYSSHSINNYKNYVRENLSGNLRESYLRKFIYQLARNKETTNLYDTLGLVNEFQGLEDQWYKLHSQISFMSFYKSLLHRISQYAEKPTNYEKSVEHRKVLSYLYTATLSKIYSMNNNVANNLVIDLQEFLNLVIRDTNKLNKLGNTVKINEYKINYQQAINEKISEAEHFIETQITPEINNIFNQINVKIELLSTEVITLQNMTREDQKMLKKQQKELEESFALRQILGSIKTASLFLSFLGPPGAAATAAIGGGIMVFESLVLDGKGTKNSGTIVTLPTAVKNSLSRITDQLKIKQTLFTKQLHDVDRKLDEFLVTQPKSDIKKIKKKISDIKLKLDEERAKGNNLDPDKISTMRKQIVELLQKQKKILEKQKTSYNVNIEKQIRIVNQVQNIVSLTEISIGFYNKIRNHQTQIDTLSDAVKQSYSKLEKLEKYEKDIYKIIIPIFKNVENDIMTMNMNLKNKSHVVLDISKWKIQSTIRDVKLQMQKMTEGFYIQEDLKRCIDKLEEGITIMINIYDRLENYHDQAKLAAYIANINSNTALEITITDNELKYAVDNSKLIIQSNLVLERYEIAMNAFRQHMFPFADFYLAEFNLPSSLKSNDPNSVMSHVVSEIENLKSRVSVSIVTINKYDKYIHNNIIFNSKSRLLSPFFVWKYKKNQNTISKLLDGEEITLKADITHGLNKNAIKFNEIGIYFKLKDESMQHDLDKHLEDFEVTMIHLGNSYYRCSNKFYIITSDKQIIKYSFAKNNNGEPLIKNSVYDKIKNNYPMLSPYTLWKIKLKNATNSFSTLANYKNQAIDLELVGRGQYIDREIDVCNEKLKKYYILDDTISEVINIGAYK